MMLVYQERCLIVLSVGVDYSTLPCIIVSRSVDKYKATEVLSYNLAENMILN